MTDLATLRIERLKIRGVCIRCAAAKARRGRVHCASCIAKLQTREEAAPQCTEITEQLARIPRTELGDLCRTLLLRYIRGEMHFGFRLSRRPGATRVLGRKPVASAPIPQQCREARHA